ncbi:hypothetical protein [Enterovibrio paralichthyis]|uniref:hypothetical protein n=1 Tax=Enterovibrio paralichthyis TaxID=2853805 RepID=UPI001C4570BA|nr:hypothetical protein [Enterovibrio paralichthyis]MBV7298636.1 hypothetical protein [Enterovibrio paralichthyis]
MKVLSICYMLPPAMYPQAIQIGRLLYHSKLEHHVITADLEHEPRKLGVYNDFANRVARINHYKEAKQLPSLLHKVLYYFAPFYGACPDNFKPWAKNVFSDYSAKLDSKAETQSDCIVSFGVPMSDHLLAMKLKAKYGTPWIAHFSDPWSDNPFKKHHILSKFINKKLEEIVISAADEVIFTSEETKKLVMSKYPDLQKGVVLGHSYDAALYPEAQAQAQAHREDGKTVIKHIGSLYGYRSPKPLFKALHSLHLEEPELLKNVCFEFVGYVAPRMKNNTDLKALPEGLVHFKGGVDYMQSLSEMSSSDALMIIDAPATESVFLPSKLIDYVGSKRPILAITPNGTSQKLVKRMGFATANPEDNSAIKDMLKSYLKQRQEYCQPLLDGTFDAVYREFSTEAILTKFDAIVERLGKK